MQRLAELSGPLTPEAIACDASDYVDFLARHDSVKPASLVWSDTALPARWRFTQPCPDRTRSRRRLRSMLAGWPPTRPTAPIFFWVCPLRPDSMSDTPSTTR